MTGVAGLNWWWTANRASVELSTRNAMRVFRDNGFASLAFPLIGAGTGGLSSQQVEELMLQALRAILATASF